MYLNDYDDTYWWKPVPGGLQQDYYLPIPQPTLGFYDMLQPYVKNQGVSPVRITRTPTTPATTPQLQGQLRRQQLLVYLHGDHRVHNPRAGRPHHHGGLRPPLGHFIGYEVQDSDGQYAVLAAVGSAVVDLRDASPHRRHQRHVRRRPLEVQRAAVHHQLQPLYYGYYHRLRISDVGTWTPSAPIQ